jgi:hypothetical protein
VASLPSERSRPASPSEPEGKGRSGPSVRAWLPIPASGLGFPFQSPGPHRARHGHPHNREPDRRSPAERGPGARDCRGFRRSPAERGPGARGCRGLRRSPGTNLVTDASREISIQVRPCIRVESRLRPGPRLTASRFDPHSETDVESVAARGLRYEIRLRASTIPDGETSEGWKGSAEPASPSPTDIHGHIGAGPPRGGLLGTS